jgi:hypothetical protein
MSYISLNDMLKKDQIINKNDNFINYYQIQGVKNKNKIKKVLVGKFEVSDIPLEKILSLKNNNYTYTLYGYLISDNDLKQLEEYNIIGYVITNKDNIICGFLNYIYNTKNKENPFEIKFENENENIILNSYPLFQGNEEIINILSITLLEDVFQRFK